MTDAEVALRLMKEIYSLHDQLETEKGNSDYWYRECKKLRENSIPVEKIPTNPEADNG